MRRRHRLRRSPQALLCLAPAGFAASRTRGPAGGKREEAAATGRVKRRRGCRAEEAGSPDFAAVGGSDARCGRISPGQEARRQESWRRRTTARIQGRRGASEGGGGGGDL
ncbi:hypothetical protein BS78_03G138200 [Paspalum vaginatum]|nr:hypothetical protein BS78_03G138200 [Paspalum vaginatum]